MDAFWKWLMRTNARWVFYCALAALILIIAWWTWKEFSSLEPEAVIPASALKDGPFPTLGIAALLANAKSNAPLDVPTGVFMALEPPRPPPPQVTNTTVNVPPTNKPPGVNPPGNKPPGAQPPVKPRDTVSLTYRGLFKIDGKVLALIEIKDSKSKGSAFYSVSNEFSSVSEDLLGVRLDSIDSNQATVILSNGSVIPLQFGTNVLFEGGNRAK